MVDHRSPARVLLVEDERNVGSTLFERLEREGFDSSWATNAAEARLEIAHRKFDLALMDVGLPDGSGFDVAMELRKSHPATAVIFLTAFSTPEDRIRGLELGAEDYVAKPFHLKELMLRIQNGLKRSRFLSSRLDTTEENAVIGKATVDFSKFEARVDGVVYSLSHKECALLRLLLERKGRVVSRDDILNQVWSENEFPSPRTVDNFVMRLRKIIESNPETPSVIKSVRGVGYLLQ